MPKRADKATLKETLRISELLKEHVEELGDGKCRYRTPGFSDTVIAKMFDPPVSFNSVQRIRAELFGNIQRDPAIGPKYKKHADRIVNVELKLDKVEHRLDELIKGFMSLCTELGTDWRAHYSE
jgi:hypothetical protein